MDRTYNHQSFVYILAMKSDIRVADSSIAVQWNHMRLMTVMNSTVKLA